MHSNPYACGTPMANLRVGYTGFKKERNNKPQMDTDKIQQQYWRQSSGVKQPSYLARKI